APAALTTRPLRTRPNWTALNTSATPTGWGPQLGRVARYACFPEPGAYPDAHGTSGPARRVGRPSGPGRGRPCGAGKTAAAGGVPPVRLLRLPGQRHLGGRARAQRQ